MWGHLCLRSQTVHLRVVRMTRSGVRIVREERELCPSKIDHRHLAGRLRGRFQPGDFTTAGVFVQATKEGRV